MNLLRKYPQRLGKMQWLFFAALSYEAEKWPSRLRRKLLNRGAKLRVYSASTGEKSTGRFSSLRWSASCS